jgi:predicted transcriptional regulator
MFIGQLWERLGITGQAISSQLRLLRSSGFIETHRDGGKVICSLVDGFEGLTSRVQAALHSVRMSLPKAPGEERSTN